MKQTKQLRVTAAVIVASMALVACGQKPGVHIEGNNVAAGGGGGLAVDGTEGAVSDDGLITLDGGTESASASESDGTTGLSGTSGSTSGTTGTTGSTSGGTSGGTTGGTSGGTTGGTSGGTTQPAQPQGGQQPAQPQGGQQPAQPPAEGEQPPAEGQQPPAEGQQPPAEGEQPPAQGTRKPGGTDRTGVTDSKITLAIHAPVSGAAPLPSTSFREAKDTYWLWKEQKGETVLGRSVEVQFADDQYRPENARQVCRQLAANSFNVSGGGGTDQIQACGQLAGVQAFPYFSAGVTEVGLEKNPWYFANSMTYKQQGVLLAQFLSKNFSGKKVAMVRTDTENFRDAEEGFAQGAQQFDLNYAGTETHSKGDQSWYSAVGQKLASQGVEVVYILSSPVDYIRFAQVNADSGYNPQYVGVGVSMGLNAVLGAGCPQVGGGIFFSPFPGLDAARSIAPEFFEASSALGKPADDIALALWGFGEAQDFVFQKYGEIFGNDLTREDYRAVVESLGKTPDQTFPGVSYSPQNHFGGTAVHVLQADCGSEQYKTIGQYKSSF